MLEYATVTMADVAFTVFQDMTEFDWKSYEYDYRNVIYRIPKRALAYTTRITMRVFDTMTYEEWGEYITSYVCRYQYCFHCISGDDGKKLQVRLP